MKKFLAIVTLAIIFFMQSVEAKDYFIHSSYTENYRGGGIGLKQTIYIDSEKISRYASHDNKGGLLRVGVIEIWNWDVANKYHPKQQVFRKDYFFFVSKGGREYSLFDGDFIGYAMTHEIPGEVVMGLKGDGLRCLVPRWKDEHGNDKFRDELVQAADKSVSDSYLLKIYGEATKILTRPQ